MPNFETSHQGLASSLRFIYGDAAHLRRDDGKIRFEFAAGGDVSLPSCQEIERLFFSKEGLAVGQALGLLETDRALRKTISACINDGEWKNTEGTE